MMMIILMATMTILSKFSCPHLSHSSGNKTLQLLQKSPQAISVSNADDDRGSNDYHGHDKTDDCDKCYKGVADADDPEHFFLIKKKAFSDGAY